MPSAMQSCIREEYHHDQSLDHSQCFQAESSERASQAGGDQSPQWQPARKLGQLRGKQLMR
jgi:hypothetical protein